MTFGGEFSDSDDSSFDDPDDPCKSYFGIQMKKGYGFWQFFALLGVSTFMVTVIAYVQAQFAYMLEDKTMFNTPPERIGRVVSDLTVYSIPFTLVFTYITSYAFELVGRKWTLFVSFMATAAVVACTPYSAPDLDWLLVGRIAIGITMAAPMAHPLIPDYVKNKSKGKAIALNGLGYVLGEVFAIGVLFNYTKSMNFYDAFLVAGGLFAFFGMLLLCTVKDPSRKRIRRQPSKHSQISHGEQVADPERRGTKASKEPLEE